MSKRLIIMALLCLLCASICSPSPSGNTHSPSGEPEGGLVEGFSVAQPPYAATVRWQAVLSDTLRVNVAVSYTAEPRQLSLDGVFITRSGTAKRYKVEASHLRYSFSDEKRPAFSLSFEIEVPTVSVPPGSSSSSGNTHSPSGVQVGGLEGGLRTRYRIHVRHDAGNGGQSYIRCVPLRLSNETLRQGEYM